MSEQSSNGYKSIPLEQALRAIVDNVADSASKTGLEAEALKLEMQFGFDMNGGEITPVVFVHESPPGHPVHRLHVAVDISSNVSESERVRMELVALSQGICDESSLEISSGGSFIEDTPPTMARNGPHAQPIDSPSLEKGEKPLARIVIPSKPVLKLRHASETGKRIPRQSVDEPPAQNTNLEHSLPRRMILPRSDEAEGAFLQKASSRFIIFDHQALQASIPATSDVDVESAQD